MPLIQVEKLKKYKGKRISLFFTEELPALPAGEDGIQPLREVEYRLSATNAGTAITVEGMIKVDLRVQCNRCLESFAYPQEIVFQEIYYDRNLHKMSAGELDWIPYTGDQIDITPEVVQNILLNLPMRFLCRDDCVGLCEVFGKDLNKEKCACSRDDLDPRLAKLRDLLK